MNENDFHKLLLSCEKPSRYVGGELNSCKPNGRDATAVIVFPDTYEIGMSHVGMRILYHLANKENDICCERAFHPWTDMEKRLRDNDLPLFSIESRRPLSDFSLVGFSIPYELLYTNVLNILDLARIPLFSTDRAETDPIVTAGGPCMFNPEPMAPYFDLVVVGEAESVFAGLCRLAAAKDMSREERLEKMAGLPGCFRPSGVELQQDGKGMISRIGLGGDSQGRKVEKLWNHSLDRTFFPCRPIVPNTEIVHDRANLEIHRGCVHGCRFCQAGYVYRPLRFRDKNNIIAAADKILDSTGYEELGLVSLNSVDHPDIIELVETLTLRLAERRISLGFPSLRMDAVSEKLAERLGGGKKTHMTLAPEAGSQRLRDIINKGLTEDRILATIDAFLKAGWRDLKLYFMIGLPGERDEDIEAIVDLVRKILARGRKAKGKEKRRRPFRVTVHVASFVAKSHTPFQWTTQADLKVLRSRMNILIQGLRDRRISLKWRDFDVGLVEGLLARGDRRLSRVIHRVWKGGAVLESWSDRFDFDLWLKALEEENLSLEHYVFRQRDRDEIFPWDYVSCGVSREYLAREYQKSLTAQETPDCVQGNCSNCGFGPSCPILKGGPGEPT